jgi:hypothetical protein
MQLMLETTNENPVNTSLKNRIDAAGAAQPTWNGIDFVAVPDALAQASRYARAKARAHTGTALTAALLRAKMGDFERAWEIAGNGISFASPAARYFYRRT